MIRNLLGLALAAWALTATAAEARRNVLLLMADDLNVSLGCYGNPLAQTPNLDKLAARGVRFQNAYCQFPLCGPSRNSLLTGLYPNRTGILQNSQIFRQTIPNAISLPQAFRLQGYFAARLGKMYHYNVPTSIGTDGHDDPASWEMESNPAGCDRMEEMDLIFSLKPGAFGATLSWLASANPDQRHTDGLLAKDAEWVLERCAKAGERPFFLAVGFFRPHTPYVSPKKYFEQYPREKMPVVRNVAEDRKDIPPAALLSSHPEEETMSDDLRQQAVQAYLASVSFMDAQVGRVLEQLRKLGLDKNTYVLFTSDHGYHLGEHGLWQKMSLFEQSARVPLIIAGPGIKPGVSKSPVGLVDVYPTLAALCEVKPPAALQGQSLVPLLDDPAAKGRGWALSQLTRRQNQKGYPGYSLRTERWRYTEWDNGAQGRELYDHEADRGELVNLADAAEHRTRVEELSKQLRAAVISVSPANGELPVLNTNTWPPVLTGTTPGARKRR